MGLVVLLISGAPEQISLGPRSASALAALGVTSLALVRGEETVGLVLEGWAFDPNRAGEAAAAVGADSAATLSALVQMSVSTATTEGGPDEKEDRAAAVGGIAARVR